jgi:hypothetical protein
MLKYGACVKECPGADTAAPVLCKPPTFMTKNPSKYKNCVYYLGPKPIRYETAKLGRFCAPSGKSLEDTAIKTFEQ